jgi:hypothetical protein
MRGFFTKNAADLGAFLWNFCGLLQGKTGKLAPEARIFTVSFQCPAKGFRRISKNHAQVVENLWIIFKYSPPVNCF